MNKKIVMMAILLSAVCFTGFAQEALTPEVQHYVAQGNKTEEKEYTFIVSGEVKMDGEWVFKKEKFTIIAKSRTSAETQAKNKFSNMYGFYEKRSITITCESTKNACQI